MNRIRQRPLSVGPLRAFEAVARLLSFRQAAEELHLTQSAVSRQIQGLEEELGAPLFVRGTRHVELTASGASLLRAVAPMLDRLDSTVRQIRQMRGRRVVGLTTFASFASLWLIPRLAEFQRDHPDFDIRMSASDEISDPDGVDIQLALRYCTPAVAPAGATRLFGEWMTPVISPWLRERVERGDAPPLRVPADLARHTLLEEFDSRPTVDHLSWRHWLAQQGLPELEPQRWLYFNYTYQQVQAALAGQGLALARVPLVAEALAAGELIEPFGPGRRIRSEHAYWLYVPEEARSRAEVAQFCAWVQEQAAATRRALGEEPPEDGLGEWD
ncbi:MAG TPA: LysR family transcriptional regulator [Burkholderiaceae bacterium]|nr:LysR family transcriptional regulator [Burkholderiaceae bacterium]